VPPIEKPVANVARIMQGIDQTISRTNDQAYYHRPEVNGIKTGLTNFNESLTNL
jgi:hypothetical protein